MAEKNDGTYLLVEPDSEAEEFVVKEIVPKLNDKPLVILGSTIGLDFNAYHISERDRKRVTIDRLVKKLKGI